MARLLSKADTPDFTRYHNVHRYKRGCRHMACDTEAGAAHVAVIGSGIMGLTTALLLRKRWGNLTVDIISEQDFVESTSHGAGGTAICCLHRDAHALPC
jgi:aspartate oxidase